MKATQRVILWFVDTMTSPVEASFACQIRSNVQILSGIGIRIVSKLFDQEQVAGT